MKTKIIREEWDVEQRLAELGTNKAELIEIAKKALAARADSTDDDPISGPGLLSWIFGTRALRKTFRVKGGWTKNSADNIPSVVNKATGIKLIFQNAESAADPLNDPRPVSSKKKASERLVAQAQIVFLFPELEAPAEEFVDIPSTAYYLFVAANEGAPTVELSSPRKVEDGQFIGFHERIFVACPGEIEGIELFDDGGGDAGQDFDVVVTSK